jgi:GntR family transcriptional regulator
MGEEDPRKYMQVAAAVRAAIAEGELTAGDQVPIAGLVTEHRVARQTAARALSLVAGEGILRRFPGHGYIVRPDRG